MRSLKGYMKYTRRSVEWQYLSVPSMYKKTPQKLVCLLNLTKIPLAIAIEKVSTEDSPAEHHR